MTNKGTYINFKDESVEYTYENSLSLSQKANYAMEVAGLVVSAQIGYAYILKETIFNYCLIKYFTDIELFENPDDFNLDLIDEFCKNNYKSVIAIVKSNAESGLIEELQKGCDEAIEFRKMHFSDYKEDVSDLLQVVREFVVKPDYMNELLVALTNFLNKASEREIDAEVVGKLADMIPVLKGMGSAEVAKAIVTAIHKDDTTAVPKTNNKSKTKKKTTTESKGIEVVK
ncbi:MAG: hypothetical protein LUE96_09565 [Lachnospiraceae bacterium]|nr:hypothetical protein [Lachnospiraceae bacterium]